MDEQRELLEAAANQRIAAIQARFAQELEAAKLQAADAEKAAAEKAAHLRRLLCRKRSWTG